MNDLLLILPRVTHARCSASSSASPALAAIRSKSDGGWVGLRVQPNPARISTGIGQIFTHQHRSRRRWRVGGRTCETMHDDHCSTFVSATIFVVDHVIIEIRTIAHPLNQWAHAPSDRARNPIEIDRDSKASWCRSHDSVRLWSESDRMTAVIAAPIVVMIAAAILSNFDRYSVKLGVRSNRSQVPVRSRPAGERAWVRRAMKKEASELSRTGRPLIVMQNNKFVYMYI